MIPEGWQQIKQLVNSALEQDVQQHAAALQQSCAEDLPLRQGAEALLSFHEQATHNLWPMRPPSRVQYLRHAFTRTMEADRENFSFILNLSDITNQLPLTINLSASYAGKVSLVIAVILALDIYAFHTSLGGQKVFAGKLLEE